jgi:hypothetical protein
MPTDRVFADRNKKASLIRRAPITTDRRNAFNEAWPLSRIDCGDDDPVGCVVDPKLAPIFGVGLTGFQGERNALSAPAYRNAGGWYEEDCEWAKVAGSLPHLFTAYERRCADATLRHYQPDAYEVINSVTLAPSDALREGVAFGRSHASAPAPSPQSVSR